MKSAKPPESVEEGARGREAGARNESTKSAGLGMTERREYIRPLPTPEVLESDSEADWATFQALISDNPTD